DLCELPAQARVPPLAARHAVSGDIWIVLTALAALAIIVAAGLFVLAGRLRGLEAARSTPDAAAALLQRQIEAVRTEARQGQDAALASVRQELGQFGGQMVQQLGDVRTAVTGQLHDVTKEVNRQLQDGLARLRDTQTAMGQRLDQAAVAVSQVHGQLGTLTEATRRMAEIGRDIAGLEQILRAPKVRGGLGEILLERLLGEILPVGSYRLQHAFRGGDKVDAV